MDFSKQQQCMVCSGNVLELFPTEIWFGLGSPASGLRSSAPSSFAGLSFIHQQLSFYRLCFSPERSIGLLPGWFSKGCSQKRICWRLRFIHRRTPWDSSSGHTGLEAPGTLLLPSNTSLCWGFRNESGIVPGVLVAVAEWDEAHRAGLSSRNEVTHGLDLSMPPEYDKRSEWTSESGTSPVTLRGLGKARTELPFVSTSNICHEPYPYLLGPFLNKSNLQTTFTMQKKCTWEGTSVFSTQLS